MGNKKQTYGPPPVGTPLTDPGWIGFMQQLWDRTSRDGGAVGESMSIIGGAGNTTLTAQFTNENLYQYLVTLNCGLYSNYSAGIGTTLFGTVGFVNRTGGQNLLTVGGFFTGVAKQGVTSGVFGGASQAFADVGSTNCGLVGWEPSVINCDPNNISSKWGLNAVFKNRLDGVATAPGGTGNNQYNYLANGLVFTAQPRSSLGEFCGWAVGIEFLSGAFDTFTPRVWNNTTAYQAGESVLSGGRVWKAIQFNGNQLPAGGSAYWVDNGPSAGTAKPVGIDFSSVSITDISKMVAAIRLRSTLPFAWEESGGILSWFDPVIARLVLVSNAGVRWLECDVTNGHLFRNGVFLI